MVCVAVAGLCDTVTLHCAPPAFRVSATVPSLTRLRPGFPSDAVTVTVVSPRPPAVGEMPNPLPVVVSVHGPVAVTVNARCRSGRAAQHRFFLRTRYFRRLPFLFAAGENRQRQQQGERAPDYLYVRGLRLLNCHVRSRL